MSKSYQQKRARALQKRTDWSYTLCLDCCRLMDPGELEAFMLLAEPEQRSTLRELRTKAGT